MSAFLRGAITWALGLVLVLLPGPVLAQSISPTDKSYEQNLLAVCDQAALLFLEKFRSRLEEAGKAGPGAVLDFFAQELSGLEKGFSNPKIQLRLKDRNSSTRTPEPDVFDCTAMSGFVRSGKKSAGAVGFFINPEGKGRHYRFYREVRLEKTCLGCHGPRKELEPGAKKLLGERFPGFEGFGYREGDVIGVVGIRVLALPKK